MPLAKRRTEQNRSSFSNHWPGPTVRGGSRSHGKGAPGGPPLPILLSQALNDECSSVQSHLTGGTDPLSMSNRHSNYCLWSGNFVLLSSQATNCLRKPTHPSGLRKSFNYRGRAGFLHFLLALEQKEEFFAHLNRLLPLSLCSPHWIANDKRFNGDLPLRYFVANRSKKWFCY